MKFKFKKTGISSFFVKIFLAFFVLCLLITLFCFQYYRSLSSTIRDESKGYLREVASRVGSNVNRIISDNYAVLYTIASGLDQAGKTTFAEVLPLLREQQEHWDYETILLIDDMGSAYDLLGQEVFLSLDDSVRADVLNRKQTMSVEQIINNREYIVFSVPVNNFSLDGKHLVALAATYAPSSFDQVLSMESFDEHAYSQLISKNGSIITRSTSGTALKTGYNVFSSLQSAQFEDSDTLGKVRSDIEANQYGQACFSLDGERRYMVYTPIDLKGWYLLTFVPYQTVNERSDMLLQATLVICGLVAITFLGLLATLVYLFSKNKRRLEQIAYVDPVTGGNTIQCFYEQAESLLNSSPTQRYALIYSNIEKFKVLNEQLGRQNCDLLLKAFYSLVISDLSPQECIGRLSADNFCMLLQYDEGNAILERFSQWRKSAEAYVTDGKIPWTLPAIEFGILVIENRTLPFPLMIDRAKLALKESPLSLDSRVRYAFYDDQLRRQLIREKQLEDRMEQALQTGEFLVYLQPKYHLPEETIGGAEALIRWKSVEEGMIYPDEFIPLFEKNGFVVQIDLYVFEQVCRKLKEWSELGLPPMKISVNCSRVHFHDPAFLSPYISIAERYGVDKKQIEIEVTESVVVENSSLLLKIIEAIREAGFCSSIDDFGSGYSSLNLLQSLPVDTLKLDRIFFQSRIPDARRGDAVVKNIISMSQELSMETVAEGVEYREHVEMLKQIGCDYVQGYVFAKPMEVSAFEKLAFPALPHREENPS